MLNDTEKRARYDNLIFGESSTRQDFNNQEAYDYWANKKSPNKVTESYEKQQERVKEVLKNYTDYDDFIKRADNHREKHSTREHLLRTEGFKDLNQKHGTDYDYF